VGTAADERATLPILVVDDDDFVRESTQRLLERAGRGVVLAEDGEAAIRLFREGRRFACVLLDVKLPRLTCAATLREIRQCDPEVVVYLFTGFDRYQIDASLLSQPNVGYLEKPLRPVAIATLGQPPTA
jgi:CheY-like chemotaxis protein